MLERSEPAGIAWRGCYEGIWRVFDAAVLSRAGTARLARRERRVVKRLLRRGFASLSPPAKYGSQFERPRENMSRLLEGVVGIEYVTSDADLESYVRRTSPRRICLTDWLLGYLTLEFHPTILPIG